MQIVYICNKALKQLFKRFKQVFLKVHQIKPSQKAKPIQLHSIQYINTLNNLFLNYFNSIKNRLIRLSCITYREYELLQRGREGIDHMAGVGLAFLIK